MHILSTFACNVLHVVLHSRGIDLSRDTNAAMARYCHSRGGGNLAVGNNLLDPHLREDDEPTHVGAAL